MMANSIRYSDMSCVQSVALHVKGVRSYMAKLCDA
jgi:hypothetical protein